MVVKDTELPHLRRCVELAAQALEAGDEPFGSVLVGADGSVLAEDHNQTGALCVLRAVGHSCLSKYGFECLKAWVLKSCA